MIILEEFERCKGCQFDPELTEKLLEWKKEKKHPAT